LIGQYPLDKFRRLSLNAGMLKLKQQFENPVDEAIARERARQLGVPFFLFDGWIAPVGVTLVQETTRFREFGPLAGSTFALGVEFAPSLAGSLSRRTASVDMRKYLRIGGTSSLLAARVRGFWSGGENPAIFYFGGNMELRGFDYLSFAGTQGFHANVELRLPVIDVMRTPIGILGPVRGTAFFGIGAARYRDEPFTFASSDPGRSFVKLDPNDPSSFLGEPVTGFHLVDSIASYGFGLQFFFLGYPLHFDWSRRTDFQISSDYRFDFWVGFDF
jgi:outer membrane protein assembly factor BamA